MREVLTAALPRGKRVSASGAATAERLLGGVHSVGFVQRAEPSADVLASVTASQTVTSSRVVACATLTAGAPQEFEHDSRSTPSAGGVCSELRRLRLLLVGLLVVPLTLAGYVALEKRTSRYGVRFTNLDVLALVLEERRPWGRHVPAALLLAAVAALFVALARPEITVAAPQERATVVLLVDVSGSMRAEDVAPSRLEAARAAMHASWTASRRRSASRWWPSPTARR